MALAPYGVWLTSEVRSDSAWRAWGDPDHDVAFLVVHRAGSSARVEDLTGGERLGIGWPARVWVDVIGYPDAAERRPGLTGADGGSERRYPPCG
jgi:hypothetical protein